MKYLTKTNLLASVGLILVVPIIVAVRLVGAAGTATLYLSPASNTYAQGARLNIDIHEDSGSDTVNAVQANLTYSNSLTFDGIDTSPDFTTVAESTGGGGSVKIGRGTCGPCGPVTGDKVVATVHFIANAAGTANVNFAAGTAVVRSNDNQSEALTLNNGTYTISSPATMTLSPASQSFIKGTSFNVAVYENSGSDQVNAVQANLSYPANLLTFVSITPNTSAWPVEAENTGSGGLVRIGRGTFSPITGSQLIATVKFTAASAGTAQVAFASGSGIIRSSDNTAEPSINTGGSYTVTTTTSNPPAGGSGSVTSSTSKPKSSSTSPPKTTTASPATQSSPVTTPLDTDGPVISNVKVINLSLNTATINWQTSEPATSEVSYGLSTKLILSKVDKNLTTKHSLALDSKELIGHKTYHFVVKSIDAAGNEAVSKDMTFKTSNSTFNGSKIVLISLGVIMIGALALAAITRFGGRGGGSSSTHGTYTEPKPVIVGGGGGQAQPIVPPQPKAPPKKPATIIAGEDPQTPGEVIVPKNSPADSPAK
ncbi:cohesin domain-containing protein [Candidatus Saccharibacteria bacterium]|nr:cohesin domain-containing protein [Candidatus Saccharibacteria bacterium]